MRTIPTMRRKARRRTGRPPGLTPDVEQTILDHLAQGVPIAHAALAAGIHRSTYHNWIVRGEDAADLRDDGKPVPEVEQPFLDFLDAATRARARGVTKAVSNIAKAAEGGYVLREISRRYRNNDGEYVTETEKVYAPIDWRAAAWWLERADRANFGRNGELPEQGAGTGSSTDVSSTDLDGLAQRIHGHMAARGELAAGGSYIDGEVVDRAS